MSKSTSGGMKGGGNNNGNANNGARRLLTESDLPVERLNLIDEKERAFFESHPVEITPYLLLGCYDVLRHKITLKRKYGVTHVINCTPLPNICAEHFEYMNVNIADRPNAQIVEFFTRTFQFVHAAAVSQGCVLVVGQPDVKVKKGRGPLSELVSQPSPSFIVPNSARGSALISSSPLSFAFGGSSSSLRGHKSHSSSSKNSSASPDAQCRITSFNSPSLNLSVALVIAILMETQHSSFFAALQTVYQKRYVSQISLAHAQQLCDWEIILNKQRNTAREEYSCLCCTNTVTMLQPFEKNVTRKTLSCSCSSSSSSVGLSFGFSPSLLTPHATSSAPALASSFDFSKSGALAPPSSSLSAPLPLSLSSSLSHPLSLSNSISQGLGPLAPSIASGACVSDHSPCPCGSCDTFLAQLRQAGRSDRTIDWAFTTIDDVQRDLDYVDEFNPPAPLTRDSWNYKPENSLWRPFRCRKCNFIVYATHKLDPTVMAVVTNNRSLVEQ